MSALTIRLPEGKHNRIRLMLERTAIVLLIPA
jgi:hypothetical protein